MNIVPPDVWKEIAPLFAAKFPHEHAIAVFPDGTYRELTNENDEPRHKITLSKADSMALLTNPPLVLLHSHINTPTAEPSDTDSINQIANGYPWGIVVVRGNEETKQLFEICEPECWGIKDKRPPLLGRPYLWGIRDCVNLCHDYYINEGYDIPLRCRIKKLDDYPKSHWAADQIRYWARKNGFKQVPRGERKVGDMITQCWGGRGNYAHDHALIYLGEGRFLHQMHGRTSEIWQPSVDEEKFLAKYSSEVWRPPARKKNKKQ